MSLAAIHADNAFATFGKLRKIDSLVDTATELSVSTVYTTNPWADGFESADISVPHENTDIQLVCYVPIQMVASTGWRNGLVQVLYSTNSGSSWISLGKSAEILGATHSNRSGCWFCTLHIPNVPVGTIRFKYKFAVCISGHTMRINPQLVLDTLTAGFKSQFIALQYENNSGLGSFSSTVRKLAEMHKGIDIAESELSTGEAESNFSTQKVLTFPQIAVNPKSGILGIARINAGMVTNLAPTSSHRGIYFTIEASYDGGSTWFSRGTTHVFRTYGGTNDKMAHSNHYSIPIFIAANGPITAGTLDIRITIDVETATTTPGYVHNKGITTGNMGTTLSVLEFSQ